MKVLFILHESSVTNGSYKSGKILLDGLREKGVDLLILVPSKHGAFDILRKEGYNVMSIRGYGWMKTTTERFRTKIKHDLQYIISFWWKFKAKRVIRNFNPDIIYSNSSVLINAFDVAKSTNKPHVFHVREYGDLDFNIITKPIDKRLKDGYSYSISITKGIADHKGLSNPKKDTVVYNGIPINDIYCEHDIYNPYFLYVGSLNEGKGIKDLLVAYADYSKMESKPYPLLVAGGYKFAIDKLKQYCDALGIDKNVKWLGRRNDVPELMQKARALIVPSHFEGFGRVVAEGMMNRTLVIGRDKAGIKEQFDNGQELTHQDIGLRFNTIEELSLRLVKAHHMQKEIYEGFIEGAYQTVIKLYSPEQYIENVYKFLLSIQKNRSRGF